MIGLSTLLFDLDGHFIFHDTELLIDNLTNANRSRRVSKVTTLDGGVFIDDGGYAPGDDNIDITVLNPTFELYQKLASIFELHGFVHIVTKNGNYLCVPATIVLKNGNAAMSFLTKSLA